MACGGAWPNERRYQQGYLPEPRCNRCGCESETLQHRNWCCPVVGGIGADDEERDGDEEEDPLAKLAKRARKDLGERSRRLGPTTPCFWNRGLVPASWTHYEDPIEEQSFTAGTEGERWRTKKATQTLFTDGSGDVPDKRLQRTGWAVVALEDASDDDEESDQEGERSDPQDEEQADQEGGQQ